MQREGKEIRKEYWSGRKNPILQINEQQTDEMYCTKEDDM